LTRKSGALYDQHDAADRGADPETGDGAAAIRAGGERGGHERDPQAGQQPREQTDVPADLGEVRAHAPEGAPEQDDARRGVHAPRQRGPHGLERRREHRPRVGDRERQRALVAVERRAVHVPYRRAEQARERAAADELGGHGLDERPRGEQIGLAAQDDVVRDPLSDERAHAVVAQRRRGPVGELVGVHDRAPRVAGEQGQHEDDGRRRDECALGQPPAPARHRAVAAVSAAPGSG
jgi:hypothetical protein